VKGAVQIRQKGLAGIVFVIFSAASLAQLVAAS